MSERWTVVLHVVSMFICGDDDPWKAMSYPTPIFLSRISLFRTTMYSCALYVPIPALGQVLMSVRKMSYSDIKNLGRAQKTLLYVR